MPDEYISRRDARIAILEKQAGGGVDQKITVGTAEAVINAVPAADVAPVVHGRWERMRESGTTLRCSACDVMVGAFLAGCSHYCYCCGARMDGAAE